MMDPNAIIIKESTLTKIFAEVFSSCNSVYAAFVSTTDGHPLAQHSKVILNESTLAAMTSSCIALGDRIAAEVHQQGCELSIIQNTEGYLAIKRVDKRWVLTVLADKKVNLGLLLTSTKNAAKLLEAEIKSHHV
jgi:hypothetical protein